MSPPPVVIALALLLAVSAATLPDQARAAAHRGYWKPAPPPPPPPPPPPTRFVMTPEMCDQYCNYAIVPPWPSVSVARRGTAATMSSTKTTKQCVAPLAGLAAACGAFLTGAGPDTPAPQSPCCAELSAFVNTNASDDGEHGSTVRCLTPPVLLRHVNKMLDAPLDEARTMYLPMVCGVVLPPETIYVCLTGQPAPPLVSRIPEKWEKTLVPGTGV